MGSGVYSGDVPRRPKSSVAKWWARCSNTINGKVSRVIRKYLVVLSAALAMIVASVAPASAGDTGGDPEAGPNLAEGRYVVVMEDVPLVTEFGREDVASVEAKNRGQQMKAEQRQARRKAGVAESAVTYSYTASLNGFAAELSDVQLNKMLNTDGVLAVIPDVMRYLQTDASPEFLGLDGHNEAWDSGYTGEDVIVGIIDSGIWPEHPSFADDGSYSDLGVELDEAVYPACDFGNTAHRADDAPFECNNKLLGARQVIPTYRALIGASPTEFNSARDDDGHGSHTAGTAAGNAGVEATVLGQDYGTISGIAPRARIIAYKGLGELGGFGSDLAAAIDQAVLDGVDVINYSIGSSTAALGPDDVAFLFAADAGVRVATSAGNSGPGAATLGSPSFVPWITTVGASTQSRFFEATLKLSRGGTFTGAGLSGTVGNSPMVDAEFAGGDLCIPGTLDAEMVEGKIVLCRRGAIARRAKSQAVLAAGGVGMVMYENSDAGDRLSDSHWVPTVHVDLTPGLAIKDYIATNRNPMGAITASGEDGKLNRAPTMASFSSRGPNTGALDIIKPDVTAPGVHIMAAYSPAGTGHQQGEMFAAIQGTSMSSPHVAGLFALLAQAHPDWSAAATRSAIMTTADTKVRDNDRITQASVFEMGAGHINPGQPSQRGTAFDPGLVYDAGFTDYLGFACDATPELFSDPAGFCAFLEGLGVATDASDLNYPSIAVAELAGTQVVTRTVTNVSSGNKAQIYTATVQAPPGYEVEVHPKQLRIAPGESASFQVRITNTGAPAGEWREGSMTWRGNGYEVRSPIAVRGVFYSAPAAVEGAGVDGSTSFPITFGYTGDYAANAHGLESATVFEDNVLQDPDQSFDPNDGFSNVHEITTSGAALLRIAMPPEATEPSADLDIFVLDGAGNLVAQSTAGGTQELIDLVLPADDTYSVYVHGWSSPGGDSDYLMYAWVVSATPGGNMSIDSAPASATTGATEDINVSWTGATAGEWHLGAVSHAGPDGLLGLTLVEVDNR